MLAIPLIPSRADIGTFSSGDYYRMWSNRLCWFESITMLWLRLRPFAGEYYYILLCTGSVCWGFRTNEGFGILLGPLALSFCPAARASPLASPSLSSYYYYTSSFFLGSNFLIPSFSVDGGKSSFLTPSPFGFYFSGLGFAAQHPKHEKDLDFFFYFYDASDIFLFLQTNTFIIQIYSFIFS